MINLLAEIQGMWTSVPSYVASETQTAAMALMSRRGTYNAQAWKDLTPVGARVLKQVGVFFADRGFDVVLDENETSVTLNIAHKDGPA